MLKIVKLDCISLLSDVTKTQMKINSDETEIFDSNYSFSLTDKEMNIAVIDVVIYLNDISLTFNEFVEM